MTDDSTVGKRTKPLQQGVVLAGRYRVHLVVGETDRARIYEAQDLQLADRRTMMCEVVGDNRDVLARAWLNSDSPWTAALLDVISLDGRVCAVFDLDADAASLPGVAGVSREQRASLIVDVARVVERTAAAGLSVRFVTDHTLWVEGLPAEGRLRAIPVPTPGRPPDESTAADLAALVRLASQQLFGIDPTVAPQTALAQLPDAIQTVFEPLYADAPAERLAAGARPDVLQAVLGLSHGASRVPVPVVHGPPPSFGTQLTAASNYARRKTVRELGGAVAILLIVLATLAPFSDVRSSSEASSGSTERVPASSTQLTPEFSALVSAVPVPEIRTHPATDYQHPTQTAVVYRSVRNDGPAPEGYEQLDSADDVPNDQRHARMFFVDSRPVRVERFDPMQRLVTTMTYAYDDLGRITTEAVYLSTGAPVSTGSYNYDRATRGDRFAGSGVYEGRHHTGAPTPRGCARVRFRLDEDGRYLSRRCFDFADDEGLFLGGHHEERFAYGRETTTQTFYSTSGREIRTYDGVHGVRETIDGQGRVSAREFLDDDGDGILNETLGAAIVEFTFSSGVATERLFDVDRSPVNGAHGWHRAVEFRRRTGELSTYATYDLSDQLVPQGVSGVAQIVYTSDDFGLVADERFLDTSGNPVTNPSGVHRIGYIRDSHDNVLRECHFGTDQRILSAALRGVSCVVSEQDEFGFVLGERFYGPDGLPAVDSVSDVHGVDLERDSLNRVSRRAYVDVNGGPGLTWAGYHAIEYSYDEWARVITSRFRGVDGAAAQTATKVASLAHEYDTVGRAVSRCFFSGTAAPVAMVTGFGRGAHCFRWVYVGDSLDEIAYTDVDGDPVAAEFADQDHRGAYLHFVWNPVGALIRQEYYDGSRTRLASRDCSSPSTCIAVDGWSWHVP
jgi:hypothetical protein